MFFRAFQHLLQVSTCRSLRNKCLNISNDACLILLQPMTSQQFLWVSPWLSYLMGTNFLLYSWTPVTDICGARKNRRNEIHNLIELTQVNSRKRFVLILPLSCSHFALLQFWISCHISYVKELFQYLIFLLFPHFIIFPHAFHPKCIHSI